MHTTNGPCPHCHDLEERAARLEVEVVEGAAVLAILEAQVRQVLEQRLAQGLNMDEALEDLERAGIDVPALLFG